MNKAMRRIRGAKGEQRRYKDGDLAVAFDPVEAFLGLHKAGCDIAQNHLAALPVFNAPGEAHADRVSGFHGVCGAKSLAKQAGNPKPVDSQGFVESFKQRGGGFRIAQLQIIRDEH